MNKKKTYPGRVIFDHLPKTAGSAINYWLRTVLGSGCVTENRIGKHTELIRNYGGSYSVISGHLEFSGEGFDSRYKYVTCFRNPVELAVSWIYFVLNGHGDDDILELRAGVRKFLDSEGDEGSAYILSNSMVNHLCLIGGGISNSHSSQLELASSILEEYELWGVTERMSDFVADFAAFLEVPEPAQLTQVNVTPRRPKTNDISPKLRSKIEQINELDMAFYGRLLARYDEARKRWKRLPVSVSPWEPLLEKQPIAFSAPDISIIRFSQDGGTNIPQGTVLRFTIEFSLSRSVTELECGIQFLDGTDSLAFATNNTQLSQLFGPLSSGTHIIQNIITANLPEGRYWVGFILLELMADKQLELARFDKLCAFQIYVDRVPPCAGYTSLPTKIQYQQKDLNVIQLVSDGHGMVELAHVMPKFFAGERQKIPFILHNMSKQDWYSLSLHQINISYHLFDDCGNCIQFDGLRTPMPEGKLISGHKTLVNVEIDMPRVEGRFRLLVMPVIENICWMDGIGFTPGDIFIDINNADSTNDVAGEYPMSVAERIEMTVSCSDVESIQKVDGAGEVTSISGVYAQRMHDGTLVIAGGYFGEWMKTIIHRLEGHHEPQEELLFHTLVQLARPGSLMVEFGCYWAYYSNWFLGAVPQSNAICIEPDENRMQVGVQNFKLNKRDAVFHMAAAGGQFHSEYAFIRESDGASVTIPVWDFAKLLEEVGTGCIDILHMDTQGAELPFLLSIARTPYHGRLRFVVISTHHQSISGSATTHRDCLSALISMGAFILSEHSVEESFSGDGLIVASFCSEDSRIAMPIISRNKPENSLFGPDPKRPVKQNADSSVALQSAQLLQGLGEQVEVVQTADGPMHIFKGDAIIGASLKTSGAFQTDKIDEVLGFLMQRFSFTPDLFVDIGANIGTHLVHALKTCGFILGLAFEPDPNNYALLTQNIAVNGLTEKAQAFKLALSSRSGAASFELCGSNFGDHRVRVTGAEPSVSFGEDQRKTISVLKDAGDDFFKENNLTLSSKTLMWVDTQGHEGHVFTGFSKQFSALQKPFIVCEFWPYGLERAGGKKMFFDFLSRCSVLYDINRPNWQKNSEYSLHRLEKLYQTMLADTRGGHYPHTDILCIL